MVRAEKVSVGNTRSIVSGRTPARSASARSTGRQASNRPGSGHIGRTAGAETKASDKAGQDETEHAHPACPYGAPPPRDGRAESRTACTDRRGRYLGDDRMGGRVV